MIPYAGLVYFLYILALLCPVVLVAWRSRTGAGPFWIVLATAVLLFVQYSTPLNLAPGIWVPELVTLIGFALYQWLLVRLAMGAMICERGEPVPIILDDALVFSDDDRIEQMFDALNRAGQKQQVIVCKFLVNFGRYHFRTDLVHEEKEEEATKSKTADDDDGVVMLFIIISSRMNSPVSI